ncbi:hypothetical protein ACFL48_01435, partial [Pseudomonadota bacterium]
MGDIEIDTRNFFDKCMDLSKEMLKRGYTRAWFTWLEWITITSFFLALGVKVSSVLLVVLGALSGALIFFTGLAASLEVLKEHSEAIEKKINKNALIL